MALFGLFERRASLENPQVPLSSPNIVGLLGLDAGYRNDSGVAVTETNALTLSAAWRATSLISSVAAALPLHGYESGTKKRAGVAADILGNPHPELTAYELWRLSYVHRLMWGNAYLQKVRDGNGITRELWPIRPERVTPSRVRPSAGNPGGKMFTVRRGDTGELDAFTTREILHLPGLGYDGIAGLSVVRHAAQALGMAKAAESYSAKLFGSGNLMGGILKTDQKLQQDQADRLKARWREKVQGMGNAHDVAILDAGATFQPVSMPNDDAQLIESRRFQISEVARFWGVPPFLLMETEKSTSWGTGLEQQSLGFVIYDLHPTWLVPTEQRITKELFDGGRAVYAKYVLEGLLRGDSAARAEFYRTMREVGAFSANDIRELEDREPVDGGDTYLQPLNMAPLGTKTGTPTPDPAQEA